MTAVIFEVRIMETLICENFWIGNAFYVNENVRKTRVLNKTPAMKVHEPVHESVHEPVHEPLCVAIQTSDAYMYYTFMSFTVNNDVLCCDLH